MKYLFFLPLSIVLTPIIIYIMRDNLQIQEAVGTVKTIVQKPTIQEISVKDKKEQFYDLIVPAVNAVYDELEQQYQDTMELIENNVTSDEIARLKKIYNVKCNEDLLKALKPHPKSIAITQAAMESAWITSRFYKQANNVYGVWSFNKNEPRVAASQKRGNKTIWLKKYATVQDSVRDYYKTLARSSAFKEFRELKMTTDDPYELVTKLDNYSELGEKYGEELSEMIRYNKFFLYDEDRGREKP